MIAGLSHSRQGPSAAVIIPGSSIGAAEESRLTRVRGAFGSPDADLALAELVSFLSRSPRDIRLTATATRVPLPEGVLGTSVDAHLAHAIYALESSGFDDALVVVCDSSAKRGYRTWVTGGPEGSGEGRRGSEGSGGVRRGPEGSGGVLGGPERSGQGRKGPEGSGEGPGGPGRVGGVREGPDVGVFRIAEAYSMMTDALNFTRGMDEHVVESLARTGRPSDQRIADKLRIDEAGLTIPEGFASYLSLAAEASVANTAASVQERLGFALSELLTRLQKATGARRLCLSGGLFYNSFFTTVAASHPAFDHVFVPAHPGNGGCAIGAALAMGDSGLDARAIGSAFLGPAYTREQVKQTLDNCKLSYDVLPEGRVLSTVVDALSRGQLAAWFHGRMEWGPRALGHRSVLASPFSPYVLENLNGFLKRRAWYRSYGVSVPLDALDTYFTGPQNRSAKAFALQTSQGSSLQTPDGSALRESPFMQYEYTPRDPTLLQHILPEGATRVRVHTVTDDEPRFLSLLRQWGEVAPAPILVNTSFNGFHEPLVCTPRDAVRVFYGTGLDVLVLEDFVIRK